MTNAHVGTAAPAVPPSNAPRFCRKDWILSEFSARLHDQLVSRIQQYA
jgi:hypothetical protein